MIEQMRRALLLCSIVGLTLGSARASMWMDPEWEQMLQESELIVLAEVVEGGEYVAKVRPLTVFKGSMGSEFYVTGFNNHNWPAEAIKLESFQIKQRFYLFLRQGESAKQYLEFIEEADRSRLAQVLSDLTGWRFGGGRYRAPMEAAKDGRLWSVWTPSAGDLPVEGEKVRCNLLRTSYPLGAPLWDRRTFEHFLKAVVTFQVDGKRDAPFLEEALQAACAAGADPLIQDEKTSDLSRWLACYYFAGGREYDAVFAKIASGEDGSARFALARLLGAVPGEEAHQLLVGMLKDKAALVQGEVVRQLAKGDATEVGPLLLAHLDEAGAGGIGPDNIMDPVRNQIDGGRDEIIRALGELKYQPAAPALIRTLEGATSAHQVTVTLDALEKMENRDYPQVLEKLLNNGDLVMTIAEWVRDHRVKAMKSAFEDFVENPPDRAVGGAHWTVIRALGAIGDEKTGVRLTAFLEKLTARECAEISDDRITQYVIGALAELRYEPARTAVEGAAFYWLGVDSAFEAKPDLLETKKNLEAQIKREAQTHFRDFARVHADALVFLKNRRALADGSAAAPEYSFRLHIGVHSSEKPELDAKALRERLTKAFPEQQGLVAVTRWDGNRGTSSGNNDARVGLTAGGNPSLLWEYAHYVKAIGDPRDLRFVKFLLDRGLAHKWGVEEELADVSKPDPE